MTPSRFFLLFLLVCSLAFTAVAFGPSARADDAKAPKQERNRALERELRKAIVRAATAETEPVRAEAGALLAGAERTSRFYAYAAELDHGHSEVRLLAARGLLELREKAGVPLICHQIVQEKRPDVRAELTRTVERFGAEGVGTLLRPYLKETGYQQRFRALQAMGVFPDMLLVPRLIEHLSLTLSGFPRVTASFTTQRAYIRKWRLVSGGTGLAVVEVPDPEVDALETGVSLEVRVRSIEVSMTVELLEHITSQSFGTDAAAWAAWYKAQQPATD